MMRATDNIYTRALPPTTRKINIPSQTKPFTGSKPKVNAPSSVAAYRAFLKSLPPPMHMKMEKVTINNEKDVAKEKEKVPEVSVNSRSERLSRSVIVISSDSEFWSDANEPEFKIDIEPKRTKKVKGAKAVLQKKVQASKFEEVEKLEEATKALEATPQTKKETNPFKLMGFKENMSENSGSMKIFHDQKPMKVQAEAPIQENGVKRQLPMRLTSRIAKLSIEDDVQPRVDLENYQTEPFKIPDSKMREIQKLSLFQVELLELASPSQFMFQCNKMSLKTLTEEMR
jgi:hypothetical protein